MPHRLHGSLYAIASGRGDDDDASQVIDGLLGWTNRALCIYVYAIAELWGRHYGRDDQYANSTL